MKKLLGVLIMLMVATAICPRMLPKASAGQSVDFMKWMTNDSGVLQLRNVYVDDVTVLDADDTTWSAGWYVAYGDITIDDRVEVDGDVGLILADGCKLTVKGGLEVQCGIFYDSALEIYAQSADDNPNKGQLITTGSSKGAGIGSTDKLPTNTSGDITIHGGFIKAVGDDSAAGIGSGRGTDAGKVTIYGGEVEARGGDWGAGIGGGASKSDGTGGLAGGPNSSGGNGGDVTIYGGKVTAVGGKMAAGIGGGNGSDGGTVSSVTAKERSVWGRGGTLTIYGGDVTAVGGIDTENASDYKYRYEAVGFGGGYNGDGGTLKMYGGSFNGIIGSGCWWRSNTSLTIGKDLLMVVTEDCTSGDGKASFKKGELFNGEFENKSWSSFTSYDLPRNFKLTAYSDPVTYEAYNPVTLRYETKQYDKCIPVRQSITEWKDGCWYVINRSGTINKPITVKGNVSLILGNDTMLHAFGGIRLEKGSTLTVYAQPDGKPGLIDVYVQDQPYVAGIGGGDGQDAGDLIIHGGVIGSMGTEYGAAIGGGLGGDGGNVTFYGGELVLKGIGARAMGQGVGGSSSGTLTLRNEYHLYDLKNEEAISLIPGKTWIEMLDIREVDVSLVPDEGQEMPEVAYRYYEQNHGLFNGTRTKYRTLAQTTDVLTDGWYVLTQDLSFTKLPVVGNAHLILTDGHTLNVEGSVKIDEGYNLAIYAQSNGDGMGALNAAKGIVCEGSSSLTIHGGTITAGLKSNGTGIGSGPDGECGTITIHDGVVNALGNANGAAIGGYIGSASGTVVINGGKVTATIREYSRAAAIGGGNAGCISSIIINGGEVTAVSNNVNGSAGAGIGCGYVGDGGRIVINGGMVTATGGKDASGIGCAVHGENAEIEINGGEVTATGGKNAAGISSDGSNGRITFGGGTVIAKGGEDGVSGVSGHSVIYKDGDVTAIGYDDNSIAFKVSIMNFADNCQIYINGSETPLQDKTKYSTECKSNRIAHIIMPVVPLELMALPDAVKEIMDEAFMGSSAEHVILPDGCESIGSKAFANCASLKLIEIPANVDVIAVDAFENSPNVVIVTPVGSPAETFAELHGLDCRPQ